jgi:uncharacterized membrane protein YfhO
MYTPPVRYGDPGWVARLNGKRVRMERSPKDGLAVTATGPGVLTFSYEPFSFRLGLFLMLVGVGAISCAGVYRVARHRSVK